MDERGSGVRGEYQDTGEKDAKRVENAAQRSKDSGYWKKHGGGGKAGRKTPKKGTTSNVL